MRVLVADRMRVEAGLGLLLDHVVVSIRDPDRKPARIKKDRKLRDVLALAFDDAEPGARFLLPETIRLMTLQDAKVIWAFVDKHKAAVPVLVVHCEMGMSRSPAVAAAITRGLGGDDDHFFREYLPNRFVYDLMLKARGG
ncbi:MAG TPA: hypothetical protein VGK67_24105 [Myxococcales bacterium]|jgi:predicted protein tyrosine phosphatase